eukprot:188937-Chlamydomonas_euryale.AAC.2
MLDPLQPSRTQTYAQELANSAWAVAALDAGGAAPRFVAELLAAADAMPAGSFSEEELRQMFQCLLWLQARLCGGVNGGGTEGRYVNGGGGQF